MGRLHFIDDPLLITRGKLGFIIAFPLGKVPRNEADEVKSKQVKAIKKPAGKYLIRLVKTFKTYGFCRSTFPKGKA
jgi:hypothetical protein